MRKPKFDNKRKQTKSQGDVSVWYWNDKTKDLCNNLLLHDNFLINIAERKILIQRTIVKYEFQPDFKPAESTQMLQN